MSSSAGNGSPRGEEQRQIRYGVVGLGWFAQAAILPAFGNARRNSRLAALFSNDQDKLREVGEHYGVSARYSYDELEEAVREASLDALYIAMPNHLHRDFTVRAARAGVHVLCEKPMAVTEEECREMIAATAEAGVKLMIAYRLHFEEANLTAIERVRCGDIGSPRLFEAAFTNAVTDPSNIRLGPTAKGGGTLYDIGIYCLNAARYIFRDEPVEVMAMGVRGDREDSAASDVTSAAILRFPGGRLATFCCSFATPDHDRYTVHGTEGMLRVEPAFQFSSALAHRLTIDGESQETEFPRRDQVAPELLYFSDCILQEREPEPSGWEGLADVRVIQALHRSAAEGRAVRLDPVDVGARPDLRQELHRPFLGKPELVQAEPPTGR